MSIDIKNLQDHASNKTTTMRQSTHQEEFQSASHVHKSMLMMKQQQCIRNRLRIMSIDITNPQECVNDENK